MIKQRKTFLDILRVSAALAVVLYHVLAAAGNVDPMVSEQALRLTTSLSVMLLWHVPVFLMITGYLWLSDDKECTYARVWPGIRRFVIVLFTVGLAYAVLGRLFETRTVSAELFLGALKDVFTGNLWDHMWYVYAVIGVYLVLPVIKPFFKTASMGSLWILTGLTFVFSILLRDIENSFGYHFPISFPVANPAYPAFYICAGGLLSRLTLPRRTPVFAGVIFCLSCTCAFLLEYFVPAYKNWTNICSCISAISLFVTVKVLGETVRDRKWLRCISVCTFGIYLLHQLFINVMIKLLHFYPLRQLPVLSVLGSWIGVVALAFGVTWLLRKIPFVKKYIL